MSERRAPYRPARKTPHSRRAGAEAMHMLVAEARKEATEGRGRYVPPVVPENITHRDLQAYAVDALIACGYRVYYEPDSRMCPSGWPDVFAVNPYARYKVLHIEIKVGKDRLKHEQALWRNDLIDARCGLYVNLRPSFWTAFLALIDDGHIARGRELLGEEA